MSTNEQYCAYIAKDKILPWIDWILESYRMREKEQYSGEYYRGYSDALDEVKRLVGTGVWDWQRGSE